MPTSIDMIMGLAIMFAFAMIMTAMTIQNIESFFIWLTIFAGFVVWGGLLDLWVLVMCIIILVLMIASNIKKRGAI